MRASNMLDNLYMEKEAARTYRDVNGNKISAKELIESLGGAKYSLKNGEKITKSKPETILGAGLLKITNDGKYNFRESSPQRIEIGRRPYALNNTNEKDAIKALRQNTNFANRLYTEGLNTGKPLELKKKKITGRFRDVSKALKAEPAKTIPKVILGAGLLAATGAELKSGIDKLKKKKSEKDKNGGEKNESK